MAIPTPAPRVARFEQLGYGLFLHWGLGSEDFNYMGPPAIIENLCACRKVGGRRTAQLCPYK